MTHESIHNFIRSFLHNFFRCGLAGWCMEIIFTALHTVSDQDLKLKGNTSLWMFPIYGSAAIFSPISKCLKHACRFTRGLTYMLLIFCTEYLSGTFLKKHNLCPWDYGDSRFHINRVIRLDYAPYWFAAGLFFEKLVASKNPTDHLHH